MKVSSGLREAGYIKTSEYVKHCAKLWELMSARNLIKIEEAHKFAQVFKI